MKKTVSTVLKAVLAASSVFLIACGGSSDNTDTTKAAVKIAIPDSAEYYI